MRYLIYLNGKRIKSLLIDYGFTLVELIVVIAILAILVVIAVPNYTSYNNDQKLNEAANQLQTILRQAQNNAQTGTQCKNTSSTGKALEWYVTFDTSSTGNANTQYTFTANCEPGISQTPQIIYFPSGIVISALRLRTSPSDTSPCSPSSSGVYFKNISSDVSFTNSGCPATTNQFIEIDISLTGTSNRRTIFVEKGGSIYVSSVPAPTAILSNCLVSGNVCDPGGSGTPCCTPLNCLFVSQENPIYTCR